MGKRDKGLSIILMIAVLGIIGSLGYVITAPKVGEKFTEFYLLNLEGKAIEYPSALSVAEEQGKVIVGIINQEYETMSYRLEVRIEGVRYTEVGPLVLEHNEKWEKVVGFFIYRLGDKQKVEFLLYKDAESEPYLKPLRLWIDVKE